MHRSSNHNILIELLMCATNVHINKSLMQKQNFCPVHMVKCTFMNHGASESCLFHAAIL